MVLINYSWISLTLQWGWVLGFYLFSKKTEGVIEVIMRQQIMIVAHLCVCKSKKHCNLIKKFTGNKFQYTPLIFENGL